MVGLGFLVLGVQEGLIGLNGVLCLPLFEVSIGLDLGAMVC